MLNAGDAIGLGKLAAQHDAIVGLHRNRLHGAIGADAHVGREIGVQRTVVVQAGDLVQVGVR